jgi:kinesin family protein 20
VAENTYTQQLQAYLRIRPSPTDSELQLSPYLELQDEKNVVMRQPADSGRAHLAKPPHVYSFDRVFAPETSQADFFSTTTLPLVEKLLQGDNGLVFAYGVSNSGKS